MSHDIKSKINYEFLKIVISMRRKKRDQNSTRVIIAEDHAGIRAGIRRLLERFPYLEIIGEAMDGIEALELVEELDPDVLLLDLEMPRMDGRWLQN
jgi:CheY-like chemotaxis protein